ncbi:MAG: hypothetical protein ABWZ82_06820, partial [Candidatus Limnocylindrales bacterium]
AMAAAMHGSPTVEVDRVPDTRDLPHWERPEATVERIVRFLDDPRSGEDGSFSPRGPSAPLAP